MTKTQLAALSAGDRAIARRVIGEMKLPDDYGAALLEMFKLHQSRKSAARIREALDRCGRLLLLVS